MPEPAEQARRADVDRDEAQRAVDLVEPEVVDPDDLAAVDVDDLLVHEVGPQEDLVRALAELVDVDRRGSAAGRRSASSDSTDDQGRKIRRRSVCTTSPVTGGYRSPTATMRSATLPIGSPCRSRTGRPIAWLR